ncbi:MAG TPA: hypothetical protein VNZ64_22990 [Candidatus Acidoferrum sp.]|nr:hypothetical protein [Candidatus Acidoferrum sp.]
MASAATSKSTSSPSTRTSASFTKSPNPPPLSTCCFTYTGGYVLPGTTPGAGQTPLPDDLERAAVEQVAYWFQNKANIGLRISWPSGGTYQQFAVQDLLPSVQAILDTNKRWSLESLHVP